MRISISSIGLAGIVLAVLYGVFTFDREVNYQEVEAIVTDVDELCYLMKMKGTTLYKTDEGDCDTLEELQTSGHPDFKGTTLKRVYYVEFDYVSPVDGEWYSARHRQSRHEDGSWIRKGDKLAILAHTTEPRKTQKL